MTKTITGIALSLCLLACGNAPIEEGIKTTDDLIEYLVAAESDEAVVYNKSSSFGQQALRRTTVNSLDELKKVGPVSSNAQLSIKYAPKATAAQMRQLAHYGKTALRNPRNLAVLSGMMATGLVVGYTIIENEEGDAPPPLPRPSGSKTVRLGSALPADQLVVGLKQFKLPEQKLNAIAEELKIQPGQGREIFQVAHLPYRSGLAAIENTQFAFVKGLSGDALLQVRLAGKFSAAAPVQVKVKMLSSKGHPIKNGKAQNANADGAVEVSRTLQPSASRDFHHFTPEAPLVFHLPVADFDPFGLELTSHCRIEARQPDGQLLAATGLLTIER